MTAKFSLRSFVRPSRLIAGLCLALAGHCAFAAANIAIINGNDPGVGFNDATPVSPVGGNTGTTLGAQRLNLFKKAASIWGAKLTSSQTIYIYATFEPLRCTATGSVLGAAGAYTIFSDFPGAKKANAWYPGALADKLAGFTLDTEDPQIIATFNSNIGTSLCSAAPFYLGFDGNNGTQLDLLTTLLHEFGHGLGFQTFTDETTGEYFFDVPAIWDYFLLDNQTNKTWVQMTPDEIVASALNTGHLVWSGSNVTSFVPSVLALGVPLLKVNAPAAAVASYDIGGASFGPSVPSTPLTGQVGEVIDQADGKTGLACDPLNATNALAVKGKIAIVDRGTCTFTVKVANVQAAGAIGAIVVDNVVATPPSDLGGADPTITIPAVRVGLLDGNKLKSAWQTRSRAGVSVTIGLDMTRRAGADPSNRALMFAPNPGQPGSSVSHYDVSARPDQLMEPFDTGSPIHTVDVPRDLTYKLLQDIGW